MRPPYFVVVLLVMVALPLSGVVAADSSTTIDHAGDGLTLDTVDDEHVHGATPFAPRTLIGIHVKSIGGTHPFLASKAVRVGEDDNFGVMSDLSEMARLRGGSVQASVRRDQQPIYEESATLVAYYMPENSTPTPGIRGTAMAETASASTTTTVNSSSGINIPDFGTGVGAAALLVTSFATVRGL